MLLVFIASVLLIGVTSVIHYEVLRIVNGALPRLRIPRRSKVLVVIFAAFAAHALEITIYGLSVYVLVVYGDTGSLLDKSGFSLMHCLYFSSETYTSLGFGDLTPVGPIRMLAGVEALNGLLLIGWSASYTYIAMERFWDTGKH